MKHFFKPVSLLFVTALASCAGKQSQYEQCDSKVFLNCLEINVQQCEDHFKLADVSCNQEIEENLAYTTMPTSVKARYHTTCVIDSLIEQSGKKPDEAKQCIKW